ncbi:MAG TPA: YfiR family protein [Candidatus Acidoferrales bacterium]
MKHRTNAPRRSARSIFSPVRIFTLILSLALLTSLIHAQRGRPTQYDIEAVYLYQFGKFVQWPAGPASTEAFPICVLGRDPFGKTLDSTIAGEKIGNTPLKADRIEDLSDVKHCRILYISPSEDARLDAILARVGSSSVLTVSDLPDFESHGGMIQFIVEDNRVRFEINVAVARKSGLSISSQLLKVAAGVRGAPAGANQ